MSIFIKKESMLLSNYGTTLFKENMISTLTIQQKKIVALATIAFGLIAMTLLLLVTRQWSLKPAAAKMSHTPEIAKTKTKIPKDSFEGVKSREETVKIKDEEANMSDENVKAANTKNEVQGLKDKIVRMKAELKAARDEAITAQTAAAEKAKDHISETENLMVDTLKTECAKYTAEEDAILGLKVKIAKFKAKITAAKKEVKTAQAEADSKAKDYLSEFESLLAFILEEEDAKAQAAAAGNA